MTETTADACRMKATAARARADAADDYAVMLVNDLLSLEWLRLAELLDNRRRSSGSVVDTER